MTLRQIDNTITGFRELEEQRMNYQAHLMRISTSWIINCNGMLKKGHKVKPKDIIPLASDQPEKRITPKNLQDKFDKADKYGPGKFAG